MPKDKALINGKVTITVRGKDGEIKRFDPTWYEKFRGQLGKPMVVSNSNSVTNEGDAICADVLSGADARAVFNNANALILTGVGWTGSAIKTNTWCNSSGNSKVMSTGYPKLKGSFGAANDSVVQYRAEFAAGALKTTGLDEAAIINNASSNSADILAYAEVTPTINVTTDDTLQVDWEITFLGST